MSTTMLRQVRLLIADTDPDNLILSDDQLLDLLDLNAEDIRLAAADALDAIATSESLVSKVIRTQDLSTNGPAVAADLRRYADKLRAQVAAAADDAVFDIVAFEPVIGPTAIEAVGVVWGL